MATIKLPKDWQWVKLSEIGKIISGGTPSTSISEYWEGSINWIAPSDLTRYKNIRIKSGKKSITELGLKKSSARLMPKGSVLFSCRAPIGYTVIADEELCTNQGFKSIIPYDFVDSLYIYYFLKASKQDAEKVASGTTFKEISLKNFSELSFPLPPLETQQAIVSKIEELFSELDKGIQDLKTAQQQLKTYRQSVLKWAFEGKLTEEWRKNRNENGTANDLLNIIQVEKENEASRIGKKLKPTNSLSSEEVSQLSDLPLGWKWVSLGEIISDLTDYHANGSYLKIKENVELLDKSNYAIMIRATNFEKNNFSKDLKYITEEAYNYMSRSKLFGGEILIGKIGNAGRVYFMPKLNSPSSLAMNLFALRFNVDVNKYIHYHLLSSFSRQEISKYVKGVGNPTIDKNSIRSLSIALPSFEEQHQIVQEIESRLSVADKMEESIAQSLQQAEALRQSILKKAFSGELV